MKSVIIQLLFAFASITAFGQTASNDAGDSLQKSYVVTDEVYLELAHMMCTCFNESSNGVLSDEITEILVNSKDKEEVVKAITLFSEDYPEIAKRDLEAIGELFKTSFFECMNSLQDSFKDYESDHTEQEISKKLYKTLSKLEECNLVYAFFLIGS